jgi:hypothetical protein
MTLRDQCLNVSRLSQCRSDGLGPSRSEQLRSADRKSRYLGSIAVRFVLGAYAFRQYFWHKACHSYLKVSTDSFLKIIMHFVIRNDMYPAVPPTPQSSIAIAIFVLDIIIIITINLHANLVGILGNAVSQTTYSSIYVQLNPTSPATCDNRSKTARESDNT